MVEKEGINPIDLAKALINKKIKMLPAEEGDYIHIHKRNGCYKVLKTHKDGFKIKMFESHVWMPWSEYKCHKGGANPIKTLTDFSIFLLSIKTQ